MQIAAAAAALCCTRASAAQQPTTTLTTTAYCWSCWSVSIDVCNPLHLPDSRFTPRRRVAALLKLEFLALFTAALLLLALQRRTRTQ